ncbi:SusC/RagA family TonB-linked outer membrane protein [Pedobacter caeni]|uniref:TonB-linked outer membrane protein, SusC/RagA family n=1 Tax=Pedobacter caeni TaxID=288992 RepID=A0A1M5DC04_9SPHI|nr:SusC/RagA family TonB-linked outer membrane protein [Pedobacter caeni]SHF64487.1 TonB-linked outer membrane protein, SusC/RagA family [Pedobacter caeni]
MKKLIPSLMALLCLFGSAVAQNRTITGTVTGKEDGLPIPGVTVKIMGAKGGTLTNQQGKYSLDVSPGIKSLTFSSLGFVSQTQTLPLNNILNVILTGDDQALSEVVITALGIQRKKNELPYAAQEVKGEELTKTRDNNFVNSLSGKVAGLDIKQSNMMGGSTNVVMRGFKSLTGNNQALFVVDGIPVSNANTNTDDQTKGKRGYDYGNAAADINPDDIASINVLKGAAATALYGSRATNGVIMITTKKGKKNSLGITVNSGVTFGKIDRTTFTKYQNEYGAGYVNQYSKKGYDSPDGNFWYLDVFGKGPSLITPFTQDASYGGAFNPDLKVFQWNAFDPTSPTYGKATSWVAAKNDPSSFYKTAVNSSQSITLDGGGDKTTFKFGYLRTDETGVLPNSKIKKNSFNFSGDHEVTSTIKISASANYTNVNGLGRYGTGYDGANPNQQFRQWWQTNVDIKEQEAAFNREKKNITWNWSDETASGAIYSNNPYWSRYKNYETDNRDRYFGNVAMTWKPLEWLDFLGRVTYDGSNELQEDRLAIGGADVSEYARYNRSANEVNFDLMANFNKQITPNLNIRGLVGSNLRRTKVSSIFAKTNGGLGTENLYSLSNSVNAINAPLERYERVAVDGLFANTTIGYKELVFLDASIRRDQSSTLPADHNSYWYPSVAGSFLFSNLMKESTWLSHGKFRINYAEVGNDAPPLSLYDVYKINPVFGGNVLTSITTDKKNPFLRPERTKSIEAGLEMNFLAGRIGFDFSYYRTNSVDQIMAVDVSTTTGFSTRFVNAGTVRNQGIEVSAFVVPIKTTDFSWTLNLNFTRNRNQVIELYEGNNNLQLADYRGGVTLNATVGEPFGTLRSTDFQYINGQKVVNDAGYYAQSAPNQVIADVNPKWAGGIQNNIKYKDLSLSFLIDIKQGGSVFSLDQYYGQATGIYRESAGLNDLGNPQRLPISQGGGVILPGVDKNGNPNTKRVEAYDNDVTPYGYINNPPAGYIYDASFVKLREAALTYALPKKWIGDKALKGVDVSLVGRNLWIIHKNTPYTDPEAGLSSGNLQGYQSGAYPSVRTIGFNFRFKF